MRKSKGGFQVIAIGCHDIALSYGATDIIKDISFSAQEGDKIGIVGINGSGKTSLLNILYGEKPTSGEVFLARGKTMGFLRQNSVMESEKTIIEEALSSFSELIRLEGELEELHARMSSQNPEIAQLCHEKNEQFSRMGGYEYKSRTRGVLKGLGFEESDMERPVNTLSGGQKTTLMLAMLILRRPDILLLDEPTNHLDLKAVEWLEEYIKASSSTIIAVSHDRYFLDDVTSKTFEIERGKGTLYPFAYSAYLQEKLKRGEIYLHQYNSQQKEIARQEAYIAQQRRWNRQRNIVAAESREKALARMDKLDAPESALKKMNFSFGSAIPSGNDVLNVQELSVRLGDNALFSSLCLDVSRSDRLFIVGPNGCGKSTLLKILTGSEKRFTGEFEFGYNVKAGYYDQENQRLSGEKTLLDEIWDEYPDMPEQKIRATLARFLFTEEEVKKRISVLSGGEKARIALAKLILSDINLLILDEPTNHLDIPSREVLEGAILDFDGTVICVSHDRYFMKKLATKILDLESSPFLFRGGYEDFRHYKRSSGEKSTRKCVSSSGKEAYLKNKEEKARRQRLQRRYEAVESEFSSLDALEKELEKAIFAETTDYKKIAELSAKKEDAAAKSAVLFSEWESLEKELADME